MNPNERASQRFFSALSQICPVESLTHLFLSHQTIIPHSSLPGTLIGAGFGGTLVSARASISDGGRAYHPEIAVALSDHPSNNEPADHILMELNPGREAARMAIEAALAAISPQGRVWIFGSKETGILSLAKRFSLCETALYKGHMRMVSLSKESRYQEKTGKKNRQPERLSLDGAGFNRFTCRDLTIISRPGLFSWLEPDPASLLLLSAMEKEEVDPGPLVLDWGCGTGLLSAVLAKQWPQSQFILSDDQWSAVRCAKRTMEINQLQDRSEVVAEDGIGSQLGQYQFSTILSNPPFHRGVRNDTSAFHAFINKGVKQLQKGGSFWLVGNRFLDHTSQLSPLLKKVEKVAENAQYTVIRGRK
jgi:16S rRNA G1207 methylase RsmC